MSGLLSVFDFLGGVDDYISDRRATRYLNVRAGKRGLDIERGRLLTQFGFDRTISQEPKPLVLMDMVDKPLGGTNG